MSDRTHLWPFLEGAFISSTGTCLKLDTTPAVDPLAVQTSFEMRFILGVYGRPEGGSLARYFEEIGLGETCEERELSFLSPEPVDGL